MSNATYITQPDRFMSLSYLQKPETPQQQNIEDLDNVCLKNVREKKKQTGKAIEVLCFSIRQ
jgi:hypothetical protein